MLTATLHDGSTIRYLPDPIGRGAEKTVFPTEDGQSVVALYHDAREAADPERFVRLQSVVGKFNPTNGAGAHWSTSYCWPTAVVVRPQLGVLTPRYPDAFFFPEGSGMFSSKEKRGKWFSSPRVRRLLPAHERGTWLGYLQLSIAMARAVSRLHNAGLAHSDLSPNNVLVDPVRGMSIIIDIDALVVPGVHPPKVLGTPGYIAPEVVAGAGDVMPSIRTDRHALAVLIYEYLLRRHPLRGPKVHAASVEEDERISMGEGALFIEHSQDTSNRPVNVRVPMQALGPDIAGLFERAFEDALHDPDRRPTASEWERALVRSVDALLPCGNEACEERWFVWPGQEAPQCPFCGTPYPRSAPVLHLYAERRAGQFLPENRRIVLWHGSSLHAWHVKSETWPGPGVDRSRHGYAVQHQGRWMLINDGEEPWRDLGNGRVIPKGQSIELKDGLRLRFSAASTGGRLAIAEVW